MDQSLSIVVSQALLPSMIIVILGVAWRRTSPGGVDFQLARRVIGVLVLNVFYPALIIAVIPTVELNREMIVAPLLYNVGILFGMFISWPLYRWLAVKNSNNSTLGALILACAYGNIISLGVPMLQAMYGTEAIRFAIYVDILAISPMLWIVGAWIAIRFGDTEERADSIGGFVVAIAKLPPVWAFLVAITLNLLDIALPTAIQTAAEMLGYATMPAMLLTIGMSLSFTSLAKYRGLAVAASIVKLIFVPAIVWLAASLVLGQSQTANATVLLAATPTMMATIILSERYKLNTELLATILVISTALFFISLPLWLSFIA